MAEQNDQVVRLQEAYANLYNEITQPDKVFVATQYFRKKWVPRLGTALSWLIIALRQHCYWNRQTGEKRDWCLVTQEELAEEIGVSPKTVRRLLQHEHAGKFVVEVKNRYRYDNQLGKLVRKHSFYRIRMDDPLIPEDEELLRQRMADELAGLSVDPETGQRDMLKLLDRMIDGDLDDEGDRPDSVEPPPEKPPPGEMSARQRSESVEEPVEGASEPKGSSDPAASNPDASPDLPDSAEPPVGEISARQRPEAPPEPVKGLVEGSDDEDHLPDKMSPRSGDEGDLPDKMSARSGHLEDKMSARSGDLSDKMSGILYTGQNVRINNSTYTVPVLSDEVQEQQQQYTPAAPVVAVVHPHELKNLTLTDDQVLIPVYIDSNSGEDEQELFSVQSLAEVVKRDIRRAGRYSPDIGLLNPREVYYSVEHALGQGSDEWTEEEERKIQKRHRLERMLGERFNRLGAFSLEEALHQYFSPELTTQFLAGKPEAELRRIEGWVAYVRRQKNLTNPAGFLRTKIEGRETSPGSNLEARSANPVEDPQSQIHNPKSQIRNPKSHIPDLEIPGTDMTSRKLWQTALDQLQLRMPQITFDNLLRYTYVARVGNDHLVVATPNPHTVEWLEHRLNPLICQTLAGILGRPVTVEYQVAADQEP